MPADRFFTKEPLIAGQSISLQEEEFHHLAHVFRMKAGETLSLVNGRGSLAQAIIENIGKQQAHLSIQSVENSQQASAELILLQALPRQPRLECILEKSVELGVTKIWLFPGEYSEKKEISANGLERMHHILISSLKQCGRLFLPELVLKPKLSSWKEGSVPKDSFFGDTDPASPYFLSYLQQKTSTSLLIAIGPEKGFHLKEVQHMKRTLGMQGVHLHKNILRTDTAAIASLSLASSFLEL